MDATDYKKNIDANQYKLCLKIKIIRHYSDLYWPTSIKYTIKWFPFLTIKEHTVIIILINIGQTAALNRGHFPYIKAIALH